MFRPLRSKCLTLQSLRLGTGIRGIHSSKPLLTFNLSAEQKCRELLDSFKDYDHVFQNEDGSSRKPPEEELKRIAYLNSYAGRRNLGIVEAFRLPKEHQKLYSANDKDLAKLKASSGLIIDKIPYEDTATGEIKWKIVREGDQKEGWENIAHYLFVPGCIALLVAIIWRDDMDVSEWARRELLYRVRSKAEKDNDTAVLDTFEKYGNPESYEFDYVGFQKDDQIIVERILSGEYDRLAKLRRRVHQD
ncbi:hypothetical protein KL929_001589 [Ogataea haglerorum]|nr:hypothetical protein KL929_001589 [Ogataea haglerorum]